MQTCRLLTASPRLSVNLSSCCKNSPVLSSLQKGGVNVRPRHKERMVIPATTPVLLLRENWLKHVCNDILEHVKSWTNQVPKQKISGNCLRFHGLLADPNKVKRTPSQLHVTTVCKKQRRPAVTAHCIFTWLPRLVENEQPRRALSRRRHRTVGHPTRFRSRAGVNFLVEFLAVL